MGFKSENYKKASELQLQMQSG